MGDAIAMPVLLGGNCEERTMRVKETGVSRKKAKVRSVRGSRCHDEVLGTVKVSSNRMVWNAKSAAHPAVLPAAPHVRSTNHLPYTLMSTSAMFRSFFALRDVVCEKAESSRKPGQPCQEGSNTWQHNAQFTAMPPRVAAPL